MRAARVSAAGESRSCPHCKATILKSSVSCPLCHHVLRFGSAAAEKSAKPVQCPLAIEGTIHHPDRGAALEYFISMEVRDETGKLLSRQSLGVGAIQKAQKRIFTVRVEMSPSGPSGEL